MTPMSLVGGMRDAVVAVVDQGIDSRLEALVYSDFSDNGRRLEVRLDDEDIQVFVRRLVELSEGEDDDDSGEGMAGEAGNLADWLIEDTFGVEARM